MIARATLHPPTFSPPTLSPHNPGPGDRNYRRDDEWNPTTRSRFHDGSHRSSDRSTLDYYRTRPSYGPREYPSPGRFEKKRRSLAWTRKDNGKRSRTEDEESEGDRKQPTSETFISSEAHSSRQSSSGDVDNEESFASEEKPVDEIERETSSESEEQSFDSKDYDEEQADTNIVDRENLPESRYVSAYVLRNLIFAPRLTGPELFSQIRVAREPFGLLSDNGDRTFDTEETKGCHEWEIRVLSVMEGEQNNEEYHDDSDCSVGNDSSVCPGCAEHYFPASWYERHLRDRLCGACSLDQVRCCRSCHCLC